MKLVFITLITLSAFSCSSSKKEDELRSTKITTKNCSSFLYSSTYSKGMQGYTLNYYSIHKDSLIATVSYSGGCQQHCFHLIWNGNAMDSYPLLIPLELVQDSVVDHCEAFITERLAFSLKDIRSKYSTNNDSVMISLKNKNTVYNLK